MVPMTVEDLSTAPFLFTTSALLSATAAQVFVELGDPSRWFPLVTSCAWHGRVGGVGSEREVSMRLFGRFREAMLVWEPPTNLALTMIATTSPLVARMGEACKLTPELGGVRVDWTVAAHPTALGRPVMPIVRRVLHEMFRRLRPKLQRRVAAQPAVAPVTTPLHGTPPT